MARSAAQGQALGRVVRVCDSAIDARELRLSLLKEIGRVVAFDAHAWLLTDPETSVGTAPLADVPSLSELPRLIRLRYLTDVNRWTALDGVGIAQLPEVATGKAPENYDWSQFVASQGFDNVASVVFRDRYGCWAWLDLWRKSKRGPFAPPELAFLNDIRESVTVALRGCQAHTFTLHRPSACPHGPGPVVLLLSPDLDVLRSTPQTHDYLKALVPPAQDRLPIPANAYNVAAQLLAVEEDVDFNPALARAHLTDGVWVTLRAARLAESGPSTAGDIAVTIEESSPSERVALFARAFGFSPRESEVLRHLVTGCDTRELAHRMFLAENTVQDYLKAIFAKTSTHSRRTVVSRALGS